MTTPIERLEALRAQSARGGGEERIAQQHAKGKLTARERIDLVVDEGSFVELDAFVAARRSDHISDDEQVLGDGVVTGFGGSTGGSSICSRRTSRCSAAASPKPTRRRS
jgi:acetyl-CoA carboxylase carboxyltransferase component